MLDPSSDATLCSTDPGRWHVAGIKTERDGSGSKIKWRNPVVRFEASSRAEAGSVYDLLADLKSHMEWAGRRQRKIARLLTLEAPPGPAGVGTEFSTTGTDGKVGRFSDRSVVTEATRPQVFEFVTESRRQGKPGRPAWTSTQVNRYEITPQPSGCGVRYRQDLVRVEGAPRIISTPLVNRLVFGVSAFFLRRGFNNLLAMAEERTDRS
jgi:hypothetical protein